MCKQLIYKSGLLLRFAYIMGTARERERKLDATGVRESHIGPARLRPPGFGGPTATALTANISDGASGLHNIRGNEYINTLIAVILHPRIYGRVAKNLREGSGLQAVALAGEVFSLYLQSAIMILR